MTAVEVLNGFGRYAGPATLILASLAEGAKHGYALTKDIESFAGVRLAPGTLYEALARLEAQGIIEGVGSPQRRRPARVARRARGGDRLPRPPRQPAPRPRAGAAAPRRQLGPRVTPADRRPGSCAGT